MLILLLMYKTIIIIIIIIRWPIVGDIFIESQDDIMLILLLMYKTIIIIIRWPIIILLLNCPAISTQRRTSHTRANED